MYLVVKGKDFQPSILYLVRLSFKYNEQIKVLQTSKI